MVGNTSIIEDCTVNHKYYEQQGFYVIASGIAPECYGATSNIRVREHGPALQLRRRRAVRAQAEHSSNKLVLRPVQRAGHGLQPVGGSAVDRQGGEGPGPRRSKDNVPIQDANSVAIKLVQAAGRRTAALVLNFTPPWSEAPPGRAELGLLDRVKVWGCSTPLNADSVAAALG